MGQGPGPLKDEGAIAAVLRDPTLSSHPAPRNPAPHRVSWVEGPLSPEGYHPGPTLASLVEEKEKEDEDEDEDKDSYKDEEKGPDDVLTHHIQALARARSNYVGRQFQGLRARLTSNAGGPHRPGDPATELLQDVRHLLTDLQDHLSKDPDVRAVFGSRGPGVPQKEEDLGNKEDWEGIYGQRPDPLVFSFAISGPYVCVSHPTSFSPSVCTCLLFHSRAFPSLREHLSHGRQPYSTPRLPLAHVFPPMSTLVGGQKPGRAGGRGGGRRVRSSGARGWTWVSQAALRSPTSTPHRRRVGSRPVPGGAGAPEARPVDATPDAASPGAAATAAATNSPAGGGGA